MSYFAEASFDDYLLENQLQPLADATKRNELEEHSVMGPGAQEVHKDVGGISSLFGAGGYLDGTVALIGTGRNKQKENELTLNGMGERVVDENRFARNIANSNTEFNYSQYKSCHEKLNGEHIFHHSGDVDFLYTTVSGISAGDVELEIDPQGDEFETVAAAMGVIGGNIWSEKDDQNPGVTTEPVINPFGDKSMKDPITKQGADDDEKHFNPAGDSMKTYEEDNPTGIKTHDTYQDRGDGQTASEQRALNRISHTGLARVNIKKHQSELIGNVTTKASIAQAMNDLNEAQSKEMGDFTKDQRDVIKKRFRYSGSNYSTNQIGLYQASKKMYNKRKKNNKDQTMSKLNQPLIGV